MAIDSRLKHLARSFNPGRFSNPRNFGITDAERIALAQRMGIPVEEIFDFESGQNSSRINFRSRDESQRFGEALRYGDTLENIYNADVPQDLRDYFAGPGLGPQFFGEGDRAMAIDPLTGQPTGLWQFAGQAEDGDPSTAPGGVLPDRLAQQYMAQLNPSWVQKDILDDRLLDKLVPGLAIAMATAGFMNGISPGVTPDIGAENMFAYEPTPGVSWATPGATPPPSSFQVAQAGMSDVPQGLFNAGGDQISMWDAYGGGLDEFGQHALQSGYTPPQGNFVMPDGSSVFVPQGVNPPTGATPRSSTNLPKAPGGTPQGGGKPAPKPADKSSMKDTLKTAASGLSLATNAAALLSGGSGGESMEAMAGDLEESEEQRQARILASTQAINDAFSGFDDTYYGGIADAYRNFAMPQFSDQVKEARRVLPMSVPHTQSSAFQRKAGNLERDILTGEANLGRDAINEANRRRGEIEFQRGQLLSLAQGSAPTESIATQAATQASSLSAPPQFNPIADMFSKYASDAATMALAQRNAAPTAAQVVRPLTFGHNRRAAEKYIA